jgi:bifunctional DNA-binding transcriptional regulator/antitoxin component of YhaV-PrlF toxin-antitoxin module
MRDRVEIELDDQGRLVLPVPLAHRLGLVRGTTLVVEQETAEATYVHVQKTAPSLIEKGGVFVITAAAEQPLDAVLHTEREHRLDDVWERNRANLT